jgi:hypothetical protein
MRYQDVYLKNTTTAAECLDRITEIEADGRNYDCSPQQWLSGAETHLKKGAVSKIEALTRKLFAFPDEEG